MKIVFTTPSARIGKHEWRMIVYEQEQHDGKLARFTEYQWRPVFQTWGDTAWRYEDRWPRYNSNDGQYAGCPKSLAARVYYPNQPQINAALQE